MLSFAQNHADRFISLLTSESAPFVERQPRTMKLLRVKSESLLLLLVLGVLRSESSSSSVINVTGSIACTIVGQVTLYPTASRQVSAKVLFDTGSSDVAISQADCGSAICKKRTSGIRTFAESFESGAIAGYISSLKALALGTPAVVLPSFDVGIITRSRGFFQPGCATDGLAGLALNQITSPGLSTITNQSRSGFTIQLCRQAISNVPQGILNSQLHGSIVLGPTTLTGSNSLAFKIDTSIAQDVGFYDIGKLEFRINGVNISAPDINPFILDTGTSLIVLNSPKVFKHVMSNLTAVAVPLLANNYTNTKFWKSVFGYLAEGDCVHSSAFANSRVNFAPLRTAYLTIQNPKNFTNQFSIPLIHLVYFPEGLPASRRNQVICPAIVLGPQNEFNILGIPAHFGRQIQCGLPDVVHIGKSLTNDGYC